MQTQDLPESRAFVLPGESQARQRYTQYAQQARKEGFEYLARLFEQTAGNEQAHAQEFLEKLQKYGRQPIENIDLSVAIPYARRDDGKSSEAAKGENEEAARAYPAFARTAREEGYEDAAALWENIARIEAMHRDVFLESYNQMQTERLYRKERPIALAVPQLRICAAGEGSFRVCPVCGKRPGLGGRRH